MKDNDGYRNLITAAFNHPAGFEIIGKSEYLTDRQKHVLLAHFRDSKTYSAIGEEQGVSGARIQQIAQSAMDGVRLTLLWACLSDRTRQEYTKPPTEYDGLSVRSRNALMRNKLTSAEKIMGYLQGNNDKTPVEAFMQLRNVGEKSAREIYKYLIRHRLYLPAVIEHGKKVA